MTKQGAFWYSKKFYNLLKNVGGGGGNYKQTHVN